MCNSFVSPINMKDLKSKSAYDMPGLVGHNSQTNIEHHEPLKVELG